MTYEEIPVVSTQPQRLIPPYDESRRDLFQLVVATKTGRCRNCHQQFHPGEVLWWKPGQPVHENCLGSEARLTTNHGASTANAIVAVAPAAYAPPVRVIDHTQMAQPTLGTPVTPPFIHAALKSGVPEDQVYSVTTLDGFRTLKLETVTKGKLQGSRIWSYKTTSEDWVGFAFHGTDNAPHVWQRFRNDPNAPGLLHAINLILAQC